MANKYDGSNVVLLKNLEGPRVRPDMYVGSLDGALFHMVKEIIDNSMDEYSNGHATYIDVAIDKKKNMITIEDDGRGLPTDIHPEEGIPTIEVLFARLHSSGKMNEDSYQSSAGKNGVGAAVVNALSKYMKVSSYREGYEYYMEFHNGGLTKTEFKKVKSKRKNFTGTVISFIPDEKVLKQYIEFNDDLIKENLEQRTFTNAGLKCIFNNGEENVTYHNPDGIMSFLDKINNDTLISKKHFITSETEHGYVEIAFMYAQNSKEKIYSFVNGIKTVSGTHESGMKTGFTRAFRSYIRSKELTPKKLDPSSIEGSDIRSGLNVVINAKLRHPSYRSQTKDDLSNPEVSGWLSSFVNNSLEDLMDKNDKEFKTISRRIVKFASSRISASKYKDKIVSVSKASSGLEFSPKFSDCVSNDPKETELFIIEGDSAKGSVMDGRVAKYQAVMPIKGKPTNARSTTTQAILTRDKELMEVTKIIFGKTDFKNITIKDLRYDKIILMTDADYDGYHIFSLMVNFFYTHFRFLIEEGKVFIAQPPKYKYTEGTDKFYYIKNDKELKEFELNKVEKGIKIKGKRTKLKDLIANKDEYLKTFNRIITEKNLSDRFIVKMMQSTEDDDIHEYLADMELAYDDKDNNIYGIYDNIWHDIHINDLIDQLELLKNIINDDNIKFTYKKENYDMHPYDFFKFVNDKYKLTYQYFKGLGEINASELFDTTMDPETRDLIEVCYLEEKSADEVMDLLFKSNMVSQRRDLYMEKFS